MLLLLTRIATFSTIGIVFAIILILFAQKVFIETHKDNIKARYVVISYVFIFILLAGSIAMILRLWGYDITDYLNAMFDSIAILLENNVPRIVATLVAIFIALMVYKISKLTLYRIGSRVSPNQRRKQTISKIMLSVAKYIIGLIGILATLSIWGVNIGPALAGLGVLGLVIGLGAQKFINDLISGFFILFEHHFDVGDWVEIAGFMGEVIDIGLKTTKVKNFKGEIRIFNNGSIDPVSNFSIVDSLAIVDFGIAYKEDVAKTIAVLTKELPALRTDQPNMLEDPRVLGVQDLANSSVNLRIACRVTSMTQWGIERAMRQRIKEILNKHDIEIPFPQVVIHNSGK